MVAIARAFVVCEPDRPTTRRQRKTLGYRGPELVPRAEIDASIWIFRQSSSDQKSAPDATLCRWLDHAQIIDRLSAQAELYNSYKVEM